MYRILFKGICLLLSHYFAYNSQILSFAMSWFHLELTMQSCSMNNAESRVTLFLFGTFFLETCYNAHNHRNRFESIMSTLSNIMLCLGSKNICVVHCNCTIVAETDHDWNKLQNDIVRKSKTTNRAKLFNTQKPRHDGCLFGWRHFQMHFSEWKYLNFN